MHANTAELIIGKNRHGPTGVVKLSFDGALTKFGNSHFEEKLASRQVNGDGAAYA